MLAALGAFLATSFRLWLKFPGRQGRRGLYRRAARLFWPAAVVFCAVWLHDRLTSRYSSLSALVASFRHAAVSVGGSATPRWPRYARC